LSIFLQLYLGLWGCQGNPDYSKKTTILSQVADKLGMEYI